jgi:hypothetical protein
VIGFESCIRAGYKGIKHPADVHGIGGEEGTDHVHAKEEDEGGIDHKGTHGHLDNGQEHWLWREGKQLCAKYFARKADADAARQ